MRKMEKEKCPMCGKEFPVEEGVTFGGMFLCPDCACEGYLCMQAMENGTKLF